ncbi:MAG: outer membrane beta-barrel protein [Lewinella sp.]
MRFLLLFLLFTSGVLSAQYNKGTLYVGQESGIEFLSVTERLFGGFGTRALGGYFLRDRLMVGAAFEVGDFAGIETINEFQVTPFARYYLPLGLSRNIHLFGEAGLTTNLDRQAALSPSLALGAEYRLAPGAMLTGTVRHTIGTQRLATFTTLDIGLNVLFGEEHSLDPALGYNNQAGDFLFNPSIGNATFGLNGVVEYSYAILQLDGGVFLSDNIALMMLANYNTTRANIGTDLMDRIISSNETALGAGLRYQINNGRKWQPYVQGGVQYIKNQRRGNTYFVNGMMVDELTDTHLSYDLGGGLMYHLSAAVALDAGFSWRPIISSDYVVFTPGDQVAANLRVVVFPSRPGRSQTR